LAALLFELRRVRQLASQQDVREQHRHDSAAQLQGDPVRRSNRLDPVDDAQYVQFDRAGPFADRQCAVRNL